MDEEADSQVSIHNLRNEDCESMTIPAECITTKVGSDQVLHDTGKGIVGDLSKDGVTDNGKIEQPIRIGESFQSSHSEGVSSSSSWLRRVGLTEADLLMEVGSENNFEEEISTVEQRSHTSGDTGEQNNLQNHRRICGEKTAPLFKANASSQIADVKNGRQVLSQLSLSNYSQHSKSTNSDGLWANDEGIRESDLMDLGNSESFHSEGISGQDLRTSFKVPNTINREKGPLSQSSSHSQYSRSTNSDGLWANTQSITEEDLFMNTENNYCSQADKVRPQEPHISNKIPESTSPETCKRQKSTETNAQETHNNAETEQSENNLNQTDNISEHLLESSNSNCSTENGPFTEETMTTTQEQSFSIDTEENGTQEPLNTENVDSDDCSGETANPVISGAETEESRPVRKPKKKSSEFDPKMRTIVRFSDILSQLKDSFTGDVHGPFGCGIQNLVQIGQKYAAGKTTFILQCEMCNAKTEIQSELEDDDTLDIGRSTVAATHNIGKGYAALQEFSANLGLLCMNVYTYQDYSTEIDDLYVEISEEQMKENGVEECRIAREMGSVVDGIPTCPVIVDGSWPVRCYNKGGRSQSGMAVIVSARTKKILYKDYKGRFCIVCVIAENAGVTPPDHRCFVNYGKDQSILKTESIIIVEGFKKSLEQHGLIYSHIIGDGDSSVYSSICNADPYDGRIHVERIQCRLHVQRNRVRDIRTIVSRFKPGHSEEAKQLKSNIFGEIARICKDVTSATNYWRIQNINENDKEKFLKRDLMNIIHHIFGDHSHCAAYFCTGQNGPGEPNLIPLLQAHELYDKLQEVMDTWSHNVHDLLIGQTANLAESYNSLLAKYIYHKGVNVQQRGMYRGRISMAAIQFNTQNAGSALHEKLGKIPPSVLLAMEEARQRKNVFNRKYKKKKKFPNLAPGESENMRTSAYYGLNPEKPDMTAEEYDEKLRQHWCFINQLDPQEIERKTCSNSTEQFLIRKKILLSYHFGEIYRMRNNTPTATKVMKILYPAVKSKAHQHYEEITKKKVKQILGGVEECGIFIEKDKPFLAAHPDGLIGTDTILLIHCPYNIRNYNITELMKTTKFGIHNIFTKDGNSINPSHHLYYEAIGCLAITGKESCKVIVASNAELVFKTVEKNDYLWQTMSHKLENFYKEYVVPEVVDSRKKRNMDLRDTVRSNANGTSNMEIPENVSQNTNGHDNNDSQMNNDEEDTIYEEFEPFNEDGANDGDFEEFEPYNDQDDENLNAFMAMELSNEDLQLLLTDEELEATHMDVFGRIMMEKTNHLYKYCSPSLRDALGRIQPLDPQRKHIQILNRGGRHWVCTFYDTEQIYIYDSAIDRGSAKLSADGLTWFLPNSAAEPYHPYLKRLFPQYSLEESPIACNGTLPT